MLTLQQRNNLNAAAGHAHQCELMTKIPAAFILSQWALESGWGAHAPNNNCFGIKEYAGCYGRQLLVTNEDFTLAAAASWIAAKAGRTATIADATPREDGKFRYECQDWFATFQSLSLCFAKRAQLFTVPPYQVFTQAFLLDGNLQNFINAIAPEYATDTNYAKLLWSIAEMPEIQASINNVRMQ